MRNQERIGTPGFRTWVLVIAACGIAVSILAATYTRTPVLQFDENYYFPLAQKISSGTFEDGYIVRPPLYPILLAGIFKIFGTDFGPALAVESLIRGMLILLVAFMARKFISTSAALVAAVLLALYPFLIWTYARFVTEVLYIPVFVLSFYFLDRALRTGRNTDMALAGFVSGLATLVRSTSLFFTIVIAIWLVLRKSRTGRFSRSNLAGAGILVAILFATISPWTVRNAVVHRALIPVDNAAAFNLYLMTSGKKINEATEEWTSWGTQAERQREGYRRWRQYLEHDPAFHLKRIGRVLPRLFSPMRHPSVNSLSLIVRGVASRPNIHLKRVLTVAVPTVFWLITAGGILGIIFLEQNPSRRALLLITVVYFVLLHAMTLARPRFLLPVNALQAIYAGALISRGLSRLGWTRHNRP
jgi:4-amino-4-deoxy-L-arabinose transferase-like glycosyltransferase